jgi:tRNA pseudouridine55 synthase
MKRDLSGVLCLDKPAGMTSFAAVREARRRLGARKAGHTGTLDPLATGVLPLCFGEATKLTQFLVEHEKVYLATVVFGAETDSQDAEGKVIATGDPAGVTREALLEAIEPFVGRTTQEVPAYSAVRVGGERLYERARRSEPTQCPTREVWVRSISLLDFALPRAVLEVTCGRGTYVRTLATDIGRVLGCRAHLGALRRLRVGSFRIEDALTIGELSSSTALRPLADALGLPRFSIDAKEAAELRQSGIVPVRASGQTAGLVAAVDPQGELCAVLRISENGCETVRVFHAPSCIPSREADGEPVPSIDQMPGIP